MDHVLILLGFARIRLNYALWQIREKLTFVFCFYFFESRILVTPSVLQRDSKLFKKVWFNVDILSEVESAQGALFTPEVIIPCLINLYKFYFGLRQFF